MHVLRSQPQTWLPSTTTRVLLLCLALAACGCCPETYGVSVGMTVRGHVELGLEVDDAYIELGRDSVRCDIESDEGRRVTLVSCWPTRKGTWTGTIGLSDGRESNFKVPVRLVCRGLHGAELAVEVFEDEILASER